MVLTRGHARYCRRQSHVLVMPMSLGSHRVARSCPFPHPPSDWVKMMRGYHKPSSATHHIYCIDQPFDAQRRHTARYSGRVDRYDELTGYHVIYDDGDEEDFVEMEDRDDVHILSDSYCVSQVRTAAEHY